MSKPLHLPPYQVPSGLAAGNDAIDYLYYGAYTAKTWTGQVPKAADAGILPVIGSANLQVYHFMSDGVTGAAPAPPLLTSASPYFGQLHYPIQLPRELILCCDPTIYAAFATAHGAALVAGQVYINAALTELNIDGWSVGLDLPSQPQTPIPGSLLHGVPPTSIDIVPLEEANFISMGGGAAGYAPVNCKVGKNGANDFVGGTRLLVAALNMLAVLEKNCSYACFYNSVAGGASGFPDAYKYRAAHAAHDQLRVQQTDPYFDKISRVLHLFWPPLSYPAEATPLASWVSDYAALCAATGNCTVVNKGLQAFPGGNTALTVADIWGYVQPFFGL